MAQIQFTDSVGAATLRNGLPAPADRFAGWTPMTRPVGDVRHGLSTGTRYLFRYRTDYGVSFRLEEIPARQTSGLYYVDIADRLVAHLLSGDTCSVQPEDGTGTVYATCGLLEGTTPTLELTDRGGLLYTLSLALVNLAGSPVRMVARYG